MERMNTYYIVCYFYMQNQLQIQIPTLDTSVKVSVKDVLSPLRSSMFNLMDQTELQVPHFSTFSDLIS